MVCAASVAVRIPPDKIGRDFFVSWFRRGPGSADGGGRCERRVSGMERRRTAVSASRISGWRKEVADFWRCGAAAREVLRAAARHSAFHRFAERESLPNIFHLPCDSEKRRNADDRMPTPETDIYVVIA